MRKTNPTTARAFLGNSSRLGRDRWIEACREAVAAIDGVQPLSAIYERGQYQRFVDDLRSSDVAVLPELAALVEREPGDRIRPGEMLNERLAAVLGACLYLVDAEEGVSSRDGKRWQEHVRKTYRRATKTRKLKTSKAAEMAREKKARYPGVIAEFRKRARAKDARRARDIWTSTAYANADEALEAIGEALPELAGLRGPAMEIITGVGRQGKRSARRTRYEANRK